MSQRLGAFFFLVGGEEDHVYTLENQRLEPKYITQLNPGNIIYSIQTSIFFRVFQGVSPESGGVEIKLWYISWVCLISFSTVETNS